LDLGFFKSAKLPAAVCGLFLAGALTAAQAGTSSSTTTSSTKTTTAASHDSKSKTKSAKSSSSKSSKKSKKSGKTASFRKRGQQKIDPQRAREIQEALIREHYMSGVASGTWDDASQKAMERFQADNGWQSKSVPDSRALIKLGLGPDHEHLLNPESAMTTTPTAPTAGPAAPKDASKNPPQK
jgi:hypothetical protein